MRLHRRRFLSRSGLAASALLGATSWPTVRPLRAASAARSPNDAITCGVIGTGGRGRYLMNIASAFDDVRIAAVCDVDERRRAEAADAVRGASGHEPRMFADFRQVLDDPAIDAVIVATPHHWHTIIATRALEAGKHVYLEKPASHVFSEGRRLVEAARRSGKIVQHGTQMRSSEVTARAGEVLRSGILGEIKRAKAWGVEPRAHHPEPVPDEAPPEGLDWDVWLGPAPARAYNRMRHHRWNDFRDYGNGEIGGDGIHDIDMARWGLGVTTHPSRITAHGSRIHLKGESDFPDNMLVAYQYGDDKVLVYENRNFAPYTMLGWDNGNLFEGTDGYMVFTRRGAFATFLGAKEEPGPSLTGSAGNEAHVRNFFDCARSGSTPNACAEVAHLSCALVHLGEIAYRVGRVIRFDPPSETILDDEHAAALLTKSYREPWS